MLGDYNASIIRHQRKWDILALEIMGKSGSKAPLSQSDATLFLRPPFYASGSTAARANRLK
jgi:hypothetical protein